MLLARKQSVDDIAKDLEKYKLEAKGVKDEFLSSEPTEDDTKWEISFEARKKSLEEIKKSISQLSPSKRQDVAKQREAVQYVEDLITRCQTHFNGKKRKTTED